MSQLTEDKSAYSSGEKPDWLTRYRDWRSRMVAKPKFRKLVGRTPVLRMIGRRKAEGVFELASGFVHSQVLYACLETGVLDALGSGPMRLTDLANGTEIPIVRLEPLLRAATALSIIHHGRDGYYTLSDTGAVVRSDQGIRTMVQHHQEFYADLADVNLLLKQTIPDTHLNRLWSYAGEDRDPVGSQDAARYSSVMTSSQRMVIDEIVSAYDFAKYQRILDVGGGQGLFACAVAQRWAELKVSLFDLPPVAAQAAGRIDEAGLASRISCHGGSFFQDSLPSGADAITLVRVLFDHGDGQVLRILSACHAALESGGEIIIAEPMAGDSSGERLSTAYFSMYLLAMGPGRCRTPEEIGALALQAGFSSWQIIRCANPMLATIIVATA